MFTPSRWVSGKRIVCYDDLYIIKLAAEDDGIVVSNDNYRDLINKSPDYKKVIEERLLMYSFVNDRWVFNMCKRISSAFACGHFKKFNCSLKIGFLEDRKCSWV